MHAKVLSNTVSCTQHKVTQWEGMECEGTWRGMWGGECGGGGGGGERGERQTNTSTVS